MTTPLPCYRCGGQPTIEHSITRGFTILCPNCYDGAPDSSTRTEYSIGDTEYEATADWNAETEHAAEQ